MQRSRYLDTKVSGLETSFLTSWSGDHPLKSWSQSKGLGSRPRPDPLVRLYFLKWPMFTSDVTVQFIHAKLAANSDMTAVDVDKSVSVWV